MHQTHLLGTGQREREIVRERDNAKGTNKTLPLVLGLACLALALAVVPTRVSRRLPPMKFCLYQYFYFL